MVKSYREQSLAIQDQRYRENYRERLKTMEKALKPIESGRQQLLRQVNRFRGR